MNLYAKARRSARVRPNDGIMVCEPGFALIHAPPHEFTVQTGGNLQRFVRIDEAGLDTVGGLARHVTPAPVKLLWRCGHDEVTTGREQNVEFKFFRQTLPTSKALVKQPAPLE